MVSASAATAPDEVRDAARETAEPRSQSEWEECRKLSSTARVRQGEALDPRQAGH